MSSAGSTLRGANGYFQAISADSKVRVRLTVLEIVAVGVSWTTRGAVGF